jgi:site-specific recombinase XerD
MKPFKSFLSARLTEYVAYRKSQGYSPKLLLQQLHAFDRYLCKQTKAPVMLSPSFFLEMRTHLGMESRTINHLLSSVRMFFRFLVRCGDYTVNPVTDIPPLPENEIIPFIFSEKQVDELLSAVCKRIRKDTKYFIGDLSKYVAILLLSRCGMRISEPLRMLRTHYRPSEKTLYIEKTKFKKDRLIPIPEAVNTELRNYLRVCDDLLVDDRNPYLLYGSKYGGLNHNLLRLVFNCAVKEIGVYQPRRVIGRTNFNAPTVHSLRHSFAVNTLLKVKARQGSPQNALPVLAVYMGHSQYEHTVKYLKMIDADQRQGLLDFVRKDPR